jgi:hypothetical protein
MWIARTRNGVLHRHPLAHRWRLGLNRIMMKCGPFVQRWDEGGCDMPLPTSHHPQKMGGNGEAPFPIDILDKARTVASLTYQTQVMSMGLAAIKSRACRSSESRACCPEIYLHMLTDKLPPRPCLSMWSYWYFLNRTH